MFIHTYSLRPVVPPQVEAWVADALLAAYYVNIHIYIYMYVYIYIYVMYVYVYIYIYISYYMVVTRLSTILYAVIS